LKNYLFCVQSIEFSANKDEGRSGVTLLALAQKVVKEGLLANNYVSIMVVNKKRKVLSF
jgi:hypothetical protein